MVSDRAIFRETIRRLLRDLGPLRTDEIYEHIKSRHPNLCNDNIKCNCGGIVTEQPEWKHQVRFAIWDMSSRNKVERVNDMWAIV